MYTKGRKKTLFGCSEWAFLKIKMPMTINETLSIIRSSIKVQFGETEFQYRDKAMEEFFAFIWNFRLMNTLKKFLRTLNENYQKASLKPGSTPNLDFQRQPS